MGLKVIKPHRRHNSLIFLGNSLPFRDDLIVWGKGNGSGIFLNSLYFNPFITYEVITLPVANGTYKIRIASEDDLKNINSPGTDPEAFSTVSVDAFTLPPKNLEFTVSGNNVTFTWEHSNTGAPDNYVFYGIQNGNVIDRTVSLALISGSLTTHTLTLATGDWKIVLEAIVSGVESENLNIVEFATPDTAQTPPRPGLPATGQPSSELDRTNPFVQTGLELTNVSVGKVRIRFLWVWGNLADSFNIYSNNGSGDVDLVTPLDNFIRLEGFVQSFTTVQLHLVDINELWKFVVRALNSNGLEDDNTNIYEIEVDGVAPDLIENIALDTTL